MRGVAAVDVLVVVVVIDAWLSVDGHENTARGVWGGEGSWMYVANERPRMMHHYFCPVLILYVPTFV